MNKFIKLVCVSILATAPAHAMEHEHFMDFEQRYLGDQLIDAAYNGNHHKALRLIHKGAPVDYENEHGMTPLLNATMNNQHECVRILLDANAPVDQTDHGGITALFYAAKNGKYETLKHLIAAKPLLNKPTQYGSTPLIGAAIYGSLNCIRALIKAGAQVNHTNTAGYSALTWAVKDCHLECVQELITAGARINRATIHELPFYLNEDAANWPRYQQICELLVEGMLKIPNQEQKESMCAFLAWAKKYGKKYGFASGFISAWRAPMLAAIYEQNKNNFVNSVAYQEVGKIEESPFKVTLLKALLAKYSANTETDESPETKRSKKE